MKIYVDESGSFLPAFKNNAWSTVLAYVSPESDRRAIDRLIRGLRAEFSHRAEVKLRDLSEARFAQFVRDLSQLRGIAFAVAVDSNHHTYQLLRQHQNEQANKVIKHIDKMRFAEGRRGLQALSEAILGLPIQLYVQLICQVELFGKVIGLSTTYYAQRQPSVIGSFRWRVDRKGVNPNKYEQAFRNILPAVLQSKSLEEPMLMLSECADYRFFKRFEYAPGAQPTYLRDEYGIDVSDCAINIGKIVSEDFRYVDSVSDAGVQVADLLASGLGRILRGSFDDPVKIAEVMGRVMLQEKFNKPPVALITLSPDERIDVSNEVSAALKAMTRYNRPFLV